MLDISSTSSIQYVVDYNCGICYIEDFVLPPHVFELNKNLHPSTLYDVIMVVQNGNGLCNAYIIDKPNNNEQSVNAYYWKLPTLDVYGPTLVYSIKHGLISVGDDAYNIARQTSLNLLRFGDDVQYQYDMKWQNIDTKWSERGYIAAGMLTDDQIICCGGSKYEKAVDVYDVTKSEMIRLAHMNYERMHAGICVDNYICKRVYVGGGSTSPKTFECYDTEKNKWTSLCNTKKKHDTWPIIWNDDANILMIGSIFQCKQFERFDIRENKWYDYMINGNTFDQLFGAGIKINSDYSRLLYFCNGYLS